MSNLKKCSTDKSHIVTHVHETIDEPITIIVFICRENSQQDILDKITVVKRLQRMASEGKLQNTCASNKNILSQWVQSVTRFSSQYDSSR